MGSHQLIAKMVYDRWKIYSGQGDRADLLIENYETYKLVVEDQRNGCTAETCFAQLNWIWTKNWPTEIGLALSINVWELLLSYSHSQSTGKCQSKAWYTVLGIRGPLNHTVRVDKAGYYYYRFTNLDNDCSVAGHVLGNRRQLHQRGQWQGSDGQLTCKCQEVHSMAMLTPEQRSSGLRRMVWIVGDVNPPKSQSKKREPHGLRISHWQMGVQTNRDTVKISKITMPTASLHTLIQPNCPWETVELSNSRSGRREPLYTDIMWIKERRTDIPISSQSGDRELRIIDVNGREWAEKFKIEPQAISVELPVEVKNGVGIRLWYSTWLPVPDDSIAWVRWTPAGRFELGIVHIRHWTKT